MQVKVAAIQLENCLGDRLRSFYEAEVFFKQAQSLGVQMIFLPELSSCGYIPNQNIWAYAEPLYGPTVKWLTEMAATYKMYIGAGFCECDGENFYNSYLIANPEGQIDGVVRKANAESYCFYPSGRSPIIKTKLGNIAIGICADNHYKWFYRKLQKEQFNLLIMPHASPSPTKTTKLIKQDDIALAKKNITDLVSLYSNNFNVPVVFVNACGALPRMQGILGKIFAKNEYSLNGNSFICNKDELSTLLTNKPDLTTLEFTLLEQTQANNTNPKSYFGFLYKGSFLTRKIIIPLDIIFGEASYQKSKKRKKLATIYKKMIDKNLPSED